MSVQTATAADRNTVIESEDKPPLRYADWQPQWKVETGKDSAIGIAIDDGCFVVLYPHGHTWRPGTHIPKEAASQIAKLLESGSLG
jgi:hypothetical protein